MAVLLLEVLAEDVFAVRVLRLAADFPAVRALFFDAFFAVRFAALRAVLRVAFLVDVRDAPGRDVLRAVLRAALRAVFFAAFFAAFLAVFLAAFFAVFLPAERVVFCAGDLLAAREALRAVLRLDVFRRAGAGASLTPASVPAASGIAPPVASIVSFTSSIVPPVHSRPHSRGQMVSLRVLSASRQVFCRDCG